MSYVSDIAYGKRVQTPRMKRAERIEKVKSVVRSAGRGAKSFGKDLYETGKYIHKDIKSTRPKIIKPKTSHKYKKHISYYKKKGKRFIPVYKKVKIKRIKKVKPTRSSSPFGNPLDFDLRF